MLTLLVLLAGTAFSFGLVRAVASEIPLLDPAAQRADVDGVVYASKGVSVLSVLRGDESRVLLKTIDDVSPIMRQAIVSVEDRRFYEHNGVDTRGIARALWQDIQSKSVVEGGSTITQQFVKNAYVRNERTLARKVREAALALVEKYQDHRLADRVFELSWTHDQVVRRQLGLADLRGGVQLHDIGVRLVFHEPDIHGVLSVLNQVESALGRSERTVERALEALHDALSRVRSNEAPHTP